MAQPGLADAGAAQPVEDQVRCAAISLLPKECGDPVFERL